MDVLIVILALVLTIYSIKKGVYPHDSVASDPD